MTFLCGAGGEGLEPFHEVPPDPRWAMTLEIVDALHRVGSYTIVAEAGPVQRLVDIQWAGHQAARILGGRASVVLCGPDDDERTTVLITYEDPDGTGLGRSQKGLDDLLRSVREEQARSARASRAARSSG